MDFKGMARGLVERLPPPLRRAVRRAYYARLLRAADERAEPDLAFLKRVVGRGARVVDAGASIGLYTKFLSALVGPGGRVYSVEPVAETYDVLVSNVRRFRLDNVLPLNYALSDADGALEMEVPVWPEGGENLYEARAAAAGTAEPSLRRVTVPSRRLDTLVPDGRIAFIKCDVEGHELSCLAGAAETVRRSRPAWLLEVWGDPDERGSHAHAVFGAMAALGYAAHCWDGVRLEPRGPGRTSVNYWFLLPEHVRALADGRLA